MKTVLPVSLGARYGIPKEALHHSPEYLGGALVVISVSAYLVTRYVRCYTGRGREEEDGHTRSESTNQQQQQQQKKQQKQKGDCRANPFDFFQFACFCWFGYLLLLLPSLGERKTAIPNVVDFVRGVVLFCLFFCCFCFCFCLCFCFLIVSGFVLFVLCARIDEQAREHNGF